MSTLEPTDEARATLELLAWVKATQPGLTVKVVAVTGGDASSDAAGLAQLAVLDHTPEAAAGRLAGRAHVGRLTGAARSRGLRRLLHTGAVPVLVTASSAPLLRWLDPTAGPVVGRAGTEGPLPGTLSAADQATLDDRVEVWSSGPELFPQRGDRDDQPELRRRHRSRIEHDLGLPEGTPLILLASDPGEVLPPDRVVQLVWDLVARQPGLHALWLTPELSPAAHRQLERHLTDTGLRAIIHPVEDQLDSWTTVAAVDVVVLVTDGAASGATNVGLPATASHVAADRLILWPADRPASEVEGEVSRLLDTAPARDDRWHAPVGGPVVLDLLGLG